MTPQGKNEQLIVPHFEVHNGGDSQLHQRSCWHRFEDYWWFRQHNAFEMQASQRFSKLQLRSHIINARVLLFLVSTFVFWVWRPIAGEFHLQDVLFFPIWSFFLTWVTQALSLFQTPLREIPNLGMNMSIQMHKRQYSVFAAWKWYYFFYQISIISVLISFVLFWGFRWKDLRNAELIQNSPMKKSVVILLNTVPLIYFFIEHYIINLLPVVPRHLPAIIIVHTVYLIVTGCVNGLWN